MRKLKKLGFLIFLALVVAIISACSDDSSSSNDNDVNNDSDNGSSGGSVELAQGITDDEILVGHLGPQTGPVAAYDNIRVGIDAYFQYYNDEFGGVNGRKLKLIAYDDEYEPSKTVQLAPRIVEEDKVFALLGNTGTAHNLAVKDLYDKHGIPVVMLGTGAEDFANPVAENWFGSGLGYYKLEAKVYLDYAVNELGAKTIGIVYQNDDYGKQFLDGLKDSLPNYEGVEIISEYTYVTGDTDFSAQAQRLKEDNPDVIFAFAIANPAANLKKELYNLGVDIPFFATSTGGNDKNLFNLAGKEAWEGTISSAYYPNPDVVTDDPLLNVYVEQMEKYHPKVDPVGFAQIGWGAAQVFVEALERTGDELTWDNFKNALHTFDNWEGSIYESVTFTPENHYGITSLFMTEAKDGQIVPISGKITLNPETMEIEYEK